MEKYKPVLLSLAVSLVTLTAYHYWIAIPANSRVIRTCNKFNLT